MRSTRSSAKNPVFQSLPNKSKKIQGQSSIATSTKQRRTHSESSADKSDDGEEGQVYERADEEKTRGRAVSSPRFERLEVQVPLRNKHAPISASERGRPITIVSASTQDKLRRLSAGRSIIGASMGKTLDEHTTRRKKSLPKKTTTIHRVSSRRGKSGATTIAGETQEAIILATAVLDRSEPRPGPHSTRLDPVSLPTSPSSAAAESTKTNLNSPGASTPTPLKRNTQNKGEESEVDKAMSELMRSALASGGGQEKELLVEEGTQHSQRVRSETRANNVPPLVEQELSDVNDTDIDDGEEGDFVGFTNHPRRTSLNSAHGEEDAFVSEGEDGDLTDQDFESDDLIQCLAQIEKSKKKFAAARSRLPRLLGYFTEIKALQNQSTIGWYNIIGTVTTSIINSHLPSEESTLERLDDVMESLISFHADTKFFESALKRLIRRNFTQRANIEKGQKAIKKAFKEYGYQSKYKPEETDTDREVEENLEKARAAMKKRNEEIEHALRLRERELFGCRTPDSSEDLARTRKRKHIEDQDDDQVRRQKQIRLVDIEEQEESGFRPTPQQYGYRAEEEGNEWSEEEDGMMVEREVEAMEEKEAEEEVGEEEVAIEDNDGEEEEREGEEDHPIVIGDDDDVEVVEVEAFGERSAKARARATAAQRASEESDGGVDVLEDREWEDQETKALLNGIEKFEGNFRFDRIKNFYGYGNDAPLRYRSVDAIREKAIEIKRELEESGHGGLMGPTWIDV